MHLSTTMPSPSDPVNEGRFVCDGRNNESSWWQQQLIAVLFVDAVDAVDVVLHCDGRLFVKSGVNHVLKLCHFDLNVVCVGECTRGCIFGFLKNGKEKERWHCAHSPIFILILVYATFLISFQKGNFRRKKTTPFLSSSTRQEMRWLHVKRSGMNPNPLVCILFCYKMSTPIKLCSILVAIFLLWCVHNHILSL